ncbi:MAG: flagellar biosynthesis protein FliQ [Spirochaetaceae bacterium]|nr:flagellar biosynthesis protein FliQ [Spirochaetaceae bacterium]MBQ8384272.1 flagellar biosynthesis protein FliQ [Spirochaetaceae bacterium]MBR2463318.1 flagellar biosynthesis protein FliQ [Spirochaetaceae bacterium]
MTIGDVTELLQEGILQILMLVAPVLGAALIIGLVVAIFQATTSIQEQTLTFAPKFFVILAVIALLGGWMFTSVGEYTVALFNMISDMGR